MTLSALRESYIVGRGKLVPESFEARAQLEAIPIGERVEVAIYREREPGFARLVYKTFSLIGEAMQWRPRNVRGWIATRTGRADFVQWPPRMIPGLWVPHGTGPADMNQVELDAFWDDARDVIRRQIIPYLEPKAAEEIGYRIDNLRDVL